MPRIRNKIRMLHFDIETAPNKGTFWTIWNVNIPISMIDEPTYLLSWAAKWEGEREVMFSSAWEDGSESMVKKMHALFDEADVVVHYNGKAFDVKHMNREFALLGLAPPSHFHQIDLLTVVKQNFKLPSNKLDYVCQYFGLGAKVKHAGIELWYGVMEGRERDQKIMEKYNKQDARLLPKLYRFLLPWIKQHPTVGLYEDKQPTRPTCSHCGSTDVSKKGRQYNTKTASYDRWKCNTCETPLRSRLSTGRTSEHYLVRTP